MKTLRNLKWAAFATLVFALVGHAAHAQVGIGTETPSEKLHVHDGSVLFTVSPLDPSEDPFYDGTSSDPFEYKMKWFHTKGAFRSIAQRTIWGDFDPQYIGRFSFACGYELSAPGMGAAAFGLRTTASGTGSLAVGELSTASGSYSLAIGSGATANGAFSVAIGENVSNNGKNHSFVLGGAANKPVQNQFDRQMVMAFSGGFRLLTNTDANLGVQLLPNANAWTVISDVNKKENFAPVNGEDFLQKISRINLTSWNYKGQDPKEFRHYGPMAQDFYAAFGKDSYGTIGNDTTINQADFDGVNLIAIQALVKRTEQLELQNRNLQAELVKLKTQIAATGPRIRTKDKREAVLRR